MRKTNSLLFLALVLILFFLRDLLTFYFSCFEHAKHDSERAGARVDFFLFLYQFSPVFCFLFYVYLVLACKHKKRTFILHSNTFDLRSQEGCVSLSREKIPREKNRRWLEKKTKVKKKTGQRKGVGLFSTQTSFSFFIFFDFLRSASLRVFSPSPSLSSTKKGEARRLHFVFSLSFFNLLTLVCVV